MPRSDIPWVVLDEDGFLTCERCSKKEPAPTLPMKLEDFTEALRVVIDKHADCEPGGGLKRKVKLSLTMEEAQRLSNLFRPGGGSETVDFTERMHGRLLKAIREAQK